MIYLQDIAQVAHDFFFYLHVTNCADICMYERDGAIDGSITSMDFVARSKMFKHLNLPVHTHRYCTYLVMLTNFDKKVISRTY